MDFLGRASPLLLCCWSLVDVAEQVIVSNLIQRSERPGDQRLRVHIERRT